jgi:PAS domain S-box-containing protein
MECRIGCAACCVAPSISSSIPGMEAGKPAGVRCIQLSEDNRCLIFDSGLRPAVCSSLRPGSEMCGSSTGEAMQHLTELELLTVPFTSQDITTMSRFNAMSIRNQIIVLIVLMTLLPMAIIVYTAVKQEQHDSDEAIEMTRSVTKQILNDQKVLLAGAEQLAATVSALPIVKQRDAASVNSLLAELVKANTQISNIIIIDRTGALWASAIPVSNSMYFGDRRYFKEVLRSGKISSGEFGIGKILHFPLLNFGYPIKDSSGDVTDVMAIVFALDRYSQLYSADYASPVSSILLADHKGTILFSSVDPTLAGRQDRPDLFNRMFSGPTEGTFEAEGYHGVKRIFSYQKLWLQGEKTPYMYIRTGLNTEHVLAKARKDLMLGIGALLPAMLIMLGVAIWFCKRSILDKISILLTVTQRIAGGDLNARVPDPVSGGEIDKLGVAFNDMAQRLQTADIAQRKSEKKYRELVENAASIILKVDMHGNINFFNEYAERFFGFSEAEIFGRNVIGTIVPETETTGRVMTEVIKTIFANPDAHTHVINENIRKNGERVWISWNNHAIREIDGSEAGILSIGQDITERKRIERELQLSEQRFRSFVENANDIVFAITSDGNFTYISPNWEEATGYGLDESIGMQFVSFVHAGDVSMFVGFIQRAFETGKKQSGAEFRVLCKDGRQLWYKANVSLIKDPYSEAVTIIGIARDTTEIKQYEETLRQSEEKFSTIFHASPDAIILSRLHDGLLLDVNESFGRITGYIVGEVIGKTSTDLGIWSDLNDRSKLEALIRKHGEVNNFEAYLTTPRNSRLLAQLSARSIQLDGITCLIVILRDITDREYILGERLKAQKLESISILAGGIAHNFNNVLTGIIGYISYSRKHLEDTDKVSEILEAAEKSSYRASGLARQLLAFSHGNATVREAILVEDLVEESVLLFMSGSNVKGTITCTSHQVINVDSHEINQAFNNIVLNALHSMPDGGTLAVRVDAIRLDEGNIYSLPSGDYAKIVFEDSGCGIAKDDLDKVFDPYFTTKDSGTGLGLSTTHSIVGKHGGHIDIVSEVGKGTSVTILLPSNSEDKVFRQ